MSFVSLSFFIFFPVVTVLYFLTPQRFRWILLLAASCIFYMAFIPSYILVLFGLIAVDYTAGLLLERAQGPRRKYILWASIASTAGILFIFKYFNFFNTNVAALAQFLNWQYSFDVLRLALPLGLSFHTFQSLSYVIEVYRGKQKAEHHLGIYALYVMFYPQLVAGPIERPQQLLPQLHQPHHFDYERVRAGLIRMAWGFFKKMVVADHLAVIVTQTFAHPTAYGGPSLLMASVFFTLQIYFDFSAYCDIALGAAQVMGFKLMENFNRPFAAKSMSEFWHRWHISLSSWFRDYFYYPMVRMQKKITPLKIYTAVIITFLITGFWHGANWTFGVFGLLHGGYIVFGGATLHIRRRIAVAVGLTKVPRLHRAWQAVVVFSCATLAGIFFRAQTVKDGIYIATHLGKGFPHWAESGYMVQALSAVVPSFKFLLLTVVLSIFVLWCEHIGREKGIFAKLVEQPAYVRWAAYWAILFMIVAFSENTASQFIYFQF